MFVWCFIALTITSEIFYSIFVLLIDEPISYATRQCFQITVQNIKTMMQNTGNVRCYMQILLFITSHVQCYLFTGKTPPFVVLLPCIICCKANGNSGNGMFFYHFCSLFSLEFSWYPTKSYIFKFIPQNKVSHAPLKVIGIPWNHP